jgi:regulator of sirC expression with transglutaminase-like and TPR domain
VIRQPLVDSFTRAVFSPDPDLAVAALLIARVEYPALDAAPYLDQLDALGREAARRLVHISAADNAPPRVDPDHYARVMVLNDYLFGELRFVGNETRYDDPRNSFLNEVLDRRTGIPITLALLYIEVARRAGLHVEGVNFPGHFLLRCPAGPGRLFPEDLIIDAFHAGAILSEDDCRALLQRRAEDEGDDEVVPQSQVLVHATKPQILARMLVNLKRAYVRMHSFPQARDMTELLLAVHPLALNELRDRGLLAYHMKDFPAALRDLQAYLQYSSIGPQHEEFREEHDLIREHVNSLRRRVASLN